MNLVLQDDIEAIGPGHYLMTHTTNPAITAATIERAVGVYEAGLADGRDSLFSVNRHQTRFYTGDGKPVNHDPDDLIPTQDLPPWYEENSCLYLFSDTSFRRTNARIGRNPIMFETPKLESVDIDEPEDWRLAESILSRGS
jgi:CMP-N-acetylneuraminic acid synthetase